MNRRDESTLRHGCFGEGNRFKIWVGAVMLSGCTFLCSAQVLTPDLKAVPEGKGWKGTTTDAKLADKDGAPAIEFNKSGLVWLEGFDFTSGTIEFDAKGKSAPPQSSFLGVAFRVMDAKNLDVVYFRPFNFRATDPERKSHAVQYESLPQWGWQKLRQERTGQFEKPIDPPPDGDAWFHAKVVVEKREVRVFVNGASEPALVVNELSDRPGGSVGLWCGGYGVIANLKITPSTTQRAQIEDPFVDRSPHKSARVTVGGVTLHFLDWGGTGKPLLFLTGLGDTAHIYDDLAPKFTDRFHALSLTWRGHGKSDRPEKGYELDTLTEDVRQFLDAMHIEQATLVGHSMAGGVLTRFAGLYPERVDSLVYLDAAYDRTDPSFKTARDKVPDVFALLTATPQNRTSIDTMRNSSKRMRGLWSEAVEASWRDGMLFSPEGKPLESGDSGRFMRLVVKGYQAPDYTTVRARTLSFYAVPNVEAAFPWITPDVNAEVRKQAQEALETDILPRQRRNIAQFRQELATGRVIELPNTKHECFIDKQDEVVRDMRAFLSSK